MRNFVRLIASSSCQSSYSILLMFLVNISGIRTLKDVRIEVPQAVFERDTVYLSCKYDLEQAALYSIKWYYKDIEFYRYVPKESPPTRIFPMDNFNVDISQSNDVQICLRQVSLSQTGSYKCEISADAPLFHTEILSSYMIVVSVNQFENPILSSELSKAEIGRKIRLNCSAPVSNPACNLTWFINDQEVSITESNGLFDNDDDIIVTHLSPIVLRNQEMSRSRIQVIATADKFRNGRITITCQAKISTIFAKNTTSHIHEFMPYFATISHATNTGHGLKNQLATVAANNTLKSSDASRSFADYGRQLLFFRNFGNALAKTSIFNKLMLPITTIITTETNIFVKFLLSFYFYYLFVILLLQ